MATISQWNNYDYNGTIFVFGVIDSTLTSNWKNVTQVKMSVDSSSNFVYSADIKDIPYYQTNNKNNTARKVFNINTFTHRINDTTQYQFSSGTHTCYLRFYYNQSSYVSANISVIVHATLSTPTVSIDENNGIVNVSRSTTSKSPRYYIEIRRKNRNIVNSGISWQDKDYIHTVVMKGVEGGKYNEGVPHTGLMPRGTGNVAGSSKKIMAPSIENPPTHERVQDDNQNTIELLSSNKDVVLYAATDTDITPITVYDSTDIQVFSTQGINDWYYKFTAPSTGVYRFYQTAFNDVDLECTLYSNSSFSTMVAESDDANERMFDLAYSMNSGQTIYINIHDYTCNGNTATFRIEKNSSLSVSSFVPYELAAGETKILSYYSSLNGYVTIYPAKKAIGLHISNDNVYDCGEKTPYFVIPVSLGVNNIIIGNNSTTSTKFWLTNTHLDIDYQPYWRVNAIEQFKACVIFDDINIKREYEDICMAQVKDALTRLSGIISETSGNSIVFSVENLGVSKLYVDETINSSQQSGRYISSNKITSSSSHVLYYAKVTKGSIYRVNYEHDALYYSTSISTNTSASLISGTSNNLWYENVGYDVGIDSNTLVVNDNASGYYVISNSSFVLEKVLGVSETFELYNETYAHYPDYYNITIRFGLDGTTWMGNQGIATSGSLNNGGNSADINGQGKWISQLCLDSKLGVAWSYAIINVDTSDIFESLYHVIHEEIAQSLGIGDDCYSREESIHWDPEYANPDWYTGIDKTVLDFAYHKDLNGYTQFDLCNEFDLPITLFREYSEYNSSSRSFQFHLKDADGNWLLRSGEYEIYAWCAAEGSNGGAISGSGNDGWDDDPYSHRSQPITLNVTGGWYWSDYGIDMKKGLKVNDVHYTIWNSFVDAVKEVMPNGTIPNNETDYGSAANLPFTDAIEKAKTTEDNKVLYAQRFNIVNYIIKQKIDTGIDVQKSLSSQVYAEYMIKLQDCRNLM